MEHLWVPCADRYIHQETTVYPGPLYAGDEIKVWLEKRQDINTQESSYAKEYEGLGQGDRLAPSKSSKRLRESLWGGTVKAKPQWIA